MLIEDRGRGKKCVFRCDECENECLHVRKYMKRQFHFCSRACSNKSQKSGVLFERVKATNRLKYGCDFPTQNDRVIKKQKETNLERYGMSALEFNAKKFLRKNGVENASQLVDHGDKVKATCLKRYGVSHPFASQEIKKKINVTNLKKYGVEWSGACKNLFRNTDWSKAARKRHATMTKAGSYVKSKLEDRFYDVLCDVFGDHDVKRQVNHLNHQIDFYVESIDTYVQFDGTYWHGLNRPLNVVKLFKSPRDRVILGTYERDRKQDKDFLNSGGVLVRITDKQFMSAVKSGNIQQMVIETITQRE